MGHFFFRSEVILNFLQNLVKYFLLIIAMLGSWIWPTRHDEYMDNKIYSESFIENILPTKYLYGRNQCKVQFYTEFFLHSFERSNRYR